MLINQVSKTTGLTKKAIEYYTSQGLVSPSVFDNGYRDYSENDVEALSKIFVLRRLDIGTDEIKTVLSDKSNTVLQVVSVRKELQLQREAAKRAILDQLSSGKTFGEIVENLRTLENSKTITEKLLDAFPGYYGRFVCLHFARFLNEPIRTRNQQTAYETIVTFLDNVPALNLTEELQEYLIEGTKHIGTEQIKDIVESTRKSIENPDNFLSANKEVLEQYLAYKQSEEYKKSPAFKITELLKEFNNASGYYDVFIPALKQLSSSYAEYCESLETANEKLLAQYPEISKISNWNE
ncbi:MerR family transcriptional regulator [Dehalobacterium formicoaceticum]|uniref:MerR family transcriptional regulator n=1 Tax=Dehalobacterium formicoaceticum TaxID=51515 RepID=A0ABT1Y6Q1_9FIRM|nr:MerR family transcriptional regulator [Dehalobacterium formicoaceticum]MCR6546568.1 MerR family transcriptional regulator [Dehalobacterium formicoaceticum]